MSTGLNVGIKYVGECNNPFFFFFFCVIIIEAVHDGFEYKPSVCNICTELVLLRCRWGFIACVNCVKDV